MTAASITGIVLLCALVPGTLCLRFTERFRGPRDGRSALEELLEVVGAGIATLLPGIIVLGVARPSVPVRFFDLTSGRSAPTSADVERGTWIVLLILLSSLVLAFLYSWISSLFMKPRSTPSAWFEVMGQGAPKRAGIKGKARRKPAIHVTLDLKDGAVVDGPIRTFDAVPHGDGRDIALRRPVHVRAAGGRRRKLTDDIFVVPESEIASLTVRYVDGR